MTGTIDFYFDFSSPYGYLASERIEALAEKHNRTLNWNPLLLGFIFPLTGQKPLVDIPMIDEYSMHDFHRSAREYGIVYNHPKTFPLSTIAACRAFYWLQTNRPEKTAEFVHAVYRAYFSKGQMIAAASDITKIANSCGLEGSGIDSANDDPKMKTICKQAVDLAIERGVFGSPFFIVDDEPFWGHDRIEQVDRWLQNNGW